MSTVKKPYNIFMVSMSGHFDWDAGIVNRNYFVLRELLRRDDIGTVITCDFPPFSRKMMVKEALKSQMFNPFLQNIVFRTPFSYVQKRMLNSKTYYHYASLFPHYAPQRFLSETKKIFQRLSFEDPILWSYDPLSYPIIKLLPFATTVFDTVDNWISHPSFTARSADLEKNYTQIGKTADVIFTVAESLHALFPQHPQTSWVPNGFDHELIQKTHETSEPAILSKLPRPIVGYMGIIQSRVDLDLVEKVAKKNPHKSFVFIGPTWPVFLSRLRPKAPELQRVARLPNVRFFGRLPFADGLRVIRHCDAVMIPHIQNDLTHSMNPMKLYEGLALGRPVISTPVAGLEHFKAHVEIAKTAEEFSEKITHAVQTDTKEKQHARQAAVSSYTWQQCVNNMIEKIG